MAKKLFGLPMFFWILIVLLGLFFVYGVGRREGFYAAACSTFQDKNSCTTNIDKAGNATPRNCTWTPGKKGGNGTCS